MNLGLLDISKSYDGHEVLRQITMSIDGPKVVGLVGRNGAGKSTLLKILAGIIRPDKGTVSIPNHTTVRPISYMAESNPLYDEMYVYEYLRWVAESYRDSSSIAEIKHIGQEMGLQPMAHKRIRELSKGYRQRVGIAAAFIGQPPVCLLDEPINGLDPAQIIEMRQIIRRQAAQRIIILSSHLLQEIEAICDEVWLLEDGCLRDVKADLVGNMFKIVPRVYSTEIDQILDIAGVTYLDYAHKHYLVQMEDEKVLDDVLRVLLDNGLGVAQVSEVSNALGTLFSNAKMT